MNHDVINDRYARLFELPDRMNRHLQVTGYCLDYRLASSEAVPADIAHRWARLNLPRSALIGSYLRLRSFAKQYKPQVVIASSDCLNVILGSTLARQIGACFIADLYDDYTAFGLARIPGTRALYRRALESSAGICAVSKTLAANIEASYPGKPVLLLESTIDAAQFGPRDRDQSLQVLGLSQLADKPLVGICGGLDANHGVDTVFAAIEAMEQAYKDVQFVIAGRVFKEHPLPSCGNVHYLGLLPHHRMANFYNAMNIVLVALANTPFGYYAFPQKAYEILACRVPAVAANVGSLGSLFADTPSSLYDPDSKESLVAALCRQLEDRLRPDVTIPTWDDQALALGEFVESLLP